MFFRRATDGTNVPVPLENQFAGAFATPCWIIGGGPSLTESVAAEILKTPAARFAMNLAGAGLLRPQFWTSYDPTPRFHRSIYLDPSITKFVHESRAMDLVPETTLKVCESPSLYIIDREKQRGFQEFPGQGNSPITDWQDSFIQTIDIAYRLGFRQLYLVGCDLGIAPSKRWLRAASIRDVSYSAGEPLGEFARRCEHVGMSRPEMEELATGQQYHFDESKSLKAAIQTDFHYYRVCQYLRLSRRAIGLSGLQIVSVTPGSRLNDHFPTCSLSTACRRIQSMIGNPASETTRGLYTQQQDRRPASLAPMRDFRPHFWSTSEKAASQKTPEKKPASHPAQKRLKQALAEVEEIPVHIDEEG
ncbi:MAG TPA: hypothetical protein VNQ76_14065 [Planctomicrobium sp.]|nr:hypothetical protein [Planctomicrobium sp.]